MRAREYKALYVTRFSPSPSGHGGNHRSYQIWQDLCDCFGQGQVDVFTYRGARKSEIVDRKRPRLMASLGRPLAVLDRLRRMIRRWPYLFADHPVDLSVNRWGRFRRLSSHDFIEGYRKHIASQTGPRVCVIEDPGFGLGVLPINRSLKFPTIAVPQNVEAWDQALPLAAETIRERYIAGLDFADEWRVYAGCDITLTISRTERALWQGLGVACMNYPYRPTGDVRSYWTRVRDRRQSVPPSENLFVMVGSAIHTTTGASFKTFLSWLTQTRPAVTEARFVVVGKGTDAIQLSDSRTLHIELRGRISDEDMTELMVRAKAVVLPQHLGFGALTRIPELSCGGIPVLASAYAGLAMESPPGVIWVEDNADAWRTALQQAEKTQVPASWDAYLAWESRQSRAIPKALSHVLEHTGW